MIQIPKSVQLLTKSNKKKPPKELEIEKQVHSDLREQKYIPIKKFYPIYSDTPDAWQADITYIREAELLNPPREKKRKGGRANIGQVSKRFYIDVGEDEDENEDEDVYKPTVSKAESRAEV